MEVEEKTTMGKRRKATLVALGLAFVVFYFALKPPTSLALIVAGALVALLMAISDPKNGIPKVALAIMAAAISICGGLTSYQSGMQSQKEAKVANETLRSTITGGVGFCYVEFPHDTPQTGGTPVVINKGSYSLYQVHARFVDMTKAKKSGALSIQDVGLDIPELFGDRVAYFTNAVIRFSDPNAQDFNIFFTARNGSWTQLIRLRSVGGVWSHAIRVFMDQLGGQNIHNPVFESISTNYPRTRIWRD